MNFIKDNSRKKGTVSKRICNNFKKETYVVKLFLSLRTDNIYKSTQVMSIKLLLLTKPLPFICDVPVDRSVYCLLSLYRVH